MIVVIILQEGNQQGVGVVSGAADTFFSKNKARSADAKLARMTKWIAIGFVAVVLALNIVAYFAVGANTTPETADTSISATADEV
jgi:preprotein translocase subunit SecG